MTTRAELQPKIITVRTSLVPYRAAVASISAADQRLSNEGAYNTLQRAVDSWSGSQADEVVSGKRALATWQKYGDELQKGAEFSAGQIGFTERFSSLADALGNGAKAVLAPLDEQVGKLRQQLNELTAARAAWEKEKEGLTPIRSRLSAETQAVYWGAPAANAQAMFARFKTLVEGLESGLRALHGGQSIDFSKLTNGMAGGLGNPFVGVAGAVAVIVIAAGLASSLWAFFRHADEVTRADRDHAVLELAKTNPKLAAELQAKFNDAEGLRNPSSISAVEVVVGVVVVGAVAYGLYKLAQRYGPRARVANPRKRKKRRQPAARESHA